MGFDNYDVKRDLRAPLGNLSKRRFLREEAPASKIDGKASRVAKAQSEEAMM